MFLVCFKSLNVSQLNKFIFSSFSNAIDINLFLMIFPALDLPCELVPLQYREYECGLLQKRLRTWS